MAAAGLAGLLLGWPPQLAAETAEPARPTITEPEAIWALPSSDKDHAYPLRIKGRVSYVDPGFHMLWLEKDKVSTYIPLAPSPPALRTGQYVVIEGRIVPNLGLNAADVSVRVLQENAPVVPLDTRGRINDLTAFHGRIVTAEGYVDSQQLNDDDHIRLMLIVEDRPVICWIKPDNPRRVPDWTGDIVRVTGLYSRRFDPTQTNTTIEFWIGRQDGLQVLGTLRNDPRFRMPATPINELYLRAPGTVVRVTGRVAAQTVGESMTVRGETGQVEIVSLQQQRVPLGAEVEAVGQVDISSGQWVVDEALYRSEPGKGGEPSGVPGGILTTVAQIRALSAEDAARKQPVDISGVVIWALPEENVPFFFLQDLTGGVRVQLDQGKRGIARFGKYLRIKGVTRAGRFAPAIDLTDYTDLGSLSNPPARPITLDQALTGQEDDEWVEMRGFLQDIVSEGDWRSIHVTTPTGDFLARLQNEENFVANAGSLIRLRGVCETLADASGHVTGVMLRVPFLHDITLEEDAPEKIYGLPLRAIRDLNQLSFGQEMTRVRIKGVVLHAVPGEFIYLQEGMAAVQVLSHERGPLSPGDRIEAVGILGREGVRTVLREAIYRKTGTGPPPPPMEIADPAVLSLADDSALVRVRGTLIDEFARPEQTRLTLQAGSTIFESTLARAAGSAPPGYGLGSGLELTGIYRLAFDDSRQMRGFQVQLRSPADVVVFQKPRLWTVQRALMVAALFAACTLLGLGWITALHRQVSRQTEQIRAQFEKQARLEIEVQRAARLESLGELAGGIAHDYNNVLTGIMGYTSMAMLDRTAMMSVGNSLREIERGARRARDLTLELLTFAKGGDPLRENIRLPDLIRETIELVVQDSGVRCECEALPGLWDVHADRGQISQAVQNLLRQALQTMPHGGRIRLALANEEIAAGTRANLRAGRYVRLSVTDTGEGIAPEQLPRIFDPYFSTKKVGALGLATVYSIVRKHRGHIEVESTPGRGTTFRIWLPAGEAAAPPPKVPAPVAPPAARPRRALLMDDEETIRTLGALVLERMGIEAAVATDGESALQIFDVARNAGRPFDLLILDLTIASGMGGRETIERIRRTDPNVPAIVSSGYSNDPVMANFRDYGFQAVVAKPYSLEQFTRVVEGLLGLVPDRGNPS